MSNLVTLTQAKNFLRVSPNFSLHVDAEYVGTGDGVVKIFTLDNSPVEGSLRLYVNNVLQAEVTNYTISGVTVTFVAPPADGAVITASYDKPVTDDTFEAYDDELIENLIETATQIAEEYTGRAFIQRDITETHYVEGPCIKLRRRPVVSITSVKQGSTTITGYEAKLSIGRLYYPWSGEYVITYKAGYGDIDVAQAAVPNAVTAVLLIVTDLYENRGDKVDSLNINGLGTVTYKAPSRALELLDTLRIGARGLG